LRALTRVCEWLRQIHPAAGALEHPLDQVLHLTLAQDGGGELAPAVPGDE
jgi:hypothetical protein